MAVELLFARKENYLRVNNRADNIIDTQECEDTDCSQTSSFAAFKFINCMVWT